MGAPAELILTLSCPDRPGIVHAVTGILAGHGANILDAQQFGSPTSHTFFLRVHLALSPAVTAEAGEADLRAGLAGITSRFALDWQLHRCSDVPAMLVLVSRAGHCLADLLHRA